MRLKKEEPNLKTVFQKGSSRAHQISAAVKVNSNSQVSDAEYNKLKQSQGGNISPDKSSIKAGKRHASFDVLIPQTGSNQQVILQKKAVNATQIPQMPHNLVSSQGALQHQHGNL